MPWEKAPDGDLTHDRLTHLLRYDRLTGKFIRRVSTAPRALAGMEAGDIDGRGYRRLRIDRKRYLAHRVAWFYVTGKWPEKEIDHKNGDKLDNRWRNLREAEVCENRRNSRVHKDSVSGHKGVSLNSTSGKWRARIWVEGQEVSLGAFETPEQAAEAYASAAKRHFGEFARI